MIHVVDTGPILKFFATNSAQHLVEALNSNPITVPEAVEYEILNTPNRHTQFKKAPNAWSRLPERFKVILPDQKTDDLDNCCRTVFGVDFDQMYKISKDRGETMALLHGLILARRGDKVTIVCDDDPARVTIQREANKLKLQQMQKKCPPGGEITLATTLDLLDWAIRSGSFETRNDFLAKYNLMAQLDSALPQQAKSAGLTGSPPWPA